MFYVLITIAVSSLIVALCCLLVMIRSLNKSYHESMKFIFEWMQMQETINRQTAEGFKMMIKEQK